MIVKIFIINLIVNVIKLNSIQIGIMKPQIIHSNGKFYDFINISDTNIGYSKINITNSKNIYFQF
jgi:hypothetical protein